MPVWTLADEPDFLVSGGEFEGDSIFFHPTRQGVLADGGDVAIFVGGNDYRLVYLDAAGSVASVFGSRGPAPGQFHTTPELLYSGGDLVAWDRGNQRLSYFRDRANVGEVSIDFPLGVEVVGFLGDGSIVTTTETGGIATLRRRMGIERDDESTSEGTRRRYMLWTSTGDSLRVLEGWPEPPPAHLLLDMGSEDGPVRSFYLSSCLPEAMHVATDDGVLIASAGDGVLAHVDSTGEQTITFTSRARGSVPKEAVEAVGQFVEGDRRTTRASARAALTRVGDVGDPLPAVWTDMVASRSGGAWLGTAMCFSDEPTRVWQVVGETGRHVANIVVPTDIRVLSVEDDRLLGVATDDLDVQHVVVYRINRYAA